MPKLFVALALACAISAPVSADFVTFESGQVRPLALSPDGSRLFAVNTPDNRLEVFEVRADGLRHSASLEVGMEPVAVAARNASEVWVVNHLSDSVSVVDVSGEPFVSRTLLVGDEPNDIVFAGSNGERAFITTAHRGQHSPYPRGEYDVAGIGRADVWVFDATDPGAALGGEPLTIIQLFGDKPRALAASSDGSRVFAAVFHSGNRTTTVNESAVCDNPGPCALDMGSAPGPLPPPLMNFAGAVGPQTGLIVQKHLASSEWRDELNRDWSDAVRFNLPDYDVFEIDADAVLPVETASFTNVGTILFNMLYDPSRDALWVSNTDANNRVRFEGEGLLAATVKPAGEPASVRGHLHEARVTLIDTAGGSVDPRHLNKHIPYDVHPVPAGVKQASVATPLGMALSVDGTTLYVTAFGSQRIAVYTADALADDSFDPLTVEHIALSGGGPTGIVLDEARQRAYALTRFDNSVAMIDTAAKVELASYALHNPEPQSVVDGRPFLYDAQLTSSNGEASCAACHVFADLDDLAWDLGDPDIAVEDNDNPFVVGGSGNEVFHPMKGPMTTQSLRGMADHGPMHWRGDRTGASGGGDPLDEDLAFKAFNGAFEGLIGREEGELEAAEMQAFTDFVLQITYPPNPARELDNSLRSDEQRGFDAYFQTPGPDIVQSCNGCHILDRASGFFGGDGRSSIEGEPQEFKVPHLRNVYQKVGMFGMPANAFILPGDNGHTGDQIRGYGLLHDGSIDTNFRFFRGVVFNQGFNAFFPDPELARRDLEAFMIAFDTNLYPVVGQQITLNPDNVDPAPGIDSAAEARVALFVDQHAAGRAELIAKLHDAGGTRGALYDGAQFVSDDGTPAQSLDDLKAHALTADQSVTFTAVPPGSGQRMAIDRDRDGVLDGLDVCPATSDPAQADSDGDGVGDACDACTLVANAAQRDSNGDGYGNACDADLNNDGVVNPQDLGLLKLAFFSAGDVDADFNGDGIVNALDLGVMKSVFFQPPGPSALAP